MTLIFKLDFLSLGSQYLREMSDAVQDLNAPMESGGGVCPCVGVLAGCERLPATCDRRHTRRTPHSVGGARLREGTTQPARCIG